MAQQGSLYQDHGCWYVRYWEVVSRNIQDDEGHAQRDLHRGSQPRLVLKGMDSKFVWLQALATK